MAKPAENGFLVELRTFQQNFYVHLLLSNPAYFVFENYISKYKIIYINNIGYTFVQDN